MTDLGELTEDSPARPPAPAAPRVDLAARRGAGARPGRGAPLDDRVRQLPPAGRAADRPAQRAGRRARRHGPQSASDAAGAGDGRSPAPGTPAGDVVVARAHHGSVSREQRALVEEELKAGRLPAVVATSSLELGIDMGAVDLVVQVESPPSVASGLQRVGRAGHQVGAVSRGVDLPEVPRRPASSARWSPSGCATGAIESMRYPRNPLDVLAQQIVAMVALDAGRPSTRSRRWCAAAAPFAGLPRSALEAVLDMLAGRYPSDAFAELRPAARLGPRHRRADRARAARSGWRSPAAARSPTAACSACSSPAATGPGRRVGELDEEMVYESRVGDVFLLGSSSWRIEDITHDRVLVTPAPGRGRPDAVLEGRLARPAGRAGPRARRVPARGRAARRPRRPRARARAAGLDEWGAGEPARLPRRAARGHRHLPDDRTIAGRAVPRRARRLAAGRALAVRRAGQRAVGAGDRRAAARAVRPRGARRCTPTTASCCGCPTPTASRPAPTSRCSSRTRSRRWSPPRSAARRCSRPGSASAPPARCCCPGATRAAARRCGSSGSAPTSCCRWPPSTATSRSCSRRCASACRTSTTCPASSG